MGVDRECVRSDAGACGDIGIVEGSDGDRDPLSGSHGGSFDSGSSQRATLAMECLLIGFMTRVQINKIADLVKDY